MSNVPRWLSWARQLQGIAQIGLSFARNAYDYQRYEQIREIAVEMAAAHSDATPEQIRSLFAQERGYMTPKIDVRGVVFNAAGQVLLVQEIADHYRWTLPGGWADVGDTPSQAVEREIREESGYEARATRLLALFDRDAAGHPPFEFAAYKLFFLCEITGGAPATSEETSGVDFFSVDALPEMSIGRVLPQQILRFHEQWRDGVLTADFN